MTRYHLTPAAREDLLDIRLFIAESSPQAALSVVSRIRREIRRLARRPGLGHSRTDLADETLRGWLVFSYLIVYRPDARPIEIVRVIHGARDLTRATDAHR